MTPTIVSPQVTHKSELTYKELKIHGCKLNTIATDTLMLQHQAITINSAD